MIQMVSGFLEEKQADKCALSGIEEFYFMYCLTSQVSQVSNLEVTISAIEKWVLPKIQSDFIKWPIVKNCPKKSGSFYCLGVVLNHFKVPESLDRL